uniref:Calcineurin-like phosphoesterase domain-containing protein n=1 Tax=Romanomermis culicivorax TaxID=13658 RepID=A0A915JYW1_ROMCU
MIDTITLCGVEEDDAKVQPLEDLHPNITNRREALNWIESQLKLFSRSHYLFVVGHYPVVSAGFHGNNKCLKQYLSPLLFAYNVTAYISGHDHTLQHLKYFDHDSELHGKGFDANRNKTHFIISGMGAKRDVHEQSDLEMRPVKKLFFYPRNSRTSTLTRAFNKKKLLSKDKGGFVFCTSTRRDTKFEFFDAFGRNLYAFRASPRY